MLLIIERMAHIISGHEHTQIEAIRKMVPDADVRVISCAGEGASAPGAILVSRREMKKRSKESIERDVSALKTFLGTLPDRDIAAVIPSANVFEIQLALALLDDLEMKVTLALRLLRPEDVIGLTEEQLTRLRRAIASQAISLHTETAELKYYLAEQHGLVSEDNFLLPCSFDPDADLPQRSIDSPTPFQVGFLGMPRNDKGAKQIPAILLALAARKTRDDREIRFTLQKPNGKRFKLSPHLYVRGCNHAVKRTRGLSIDWLDGGIDDARFRDLIARQNLLLLPYLLKNYQYRGSGMVSDAVLAGVPVLHTRGMAMRHLLEHTATAADGPEEFADAILELSEARPPNPQDINRSRAVLRGELARTKALLTRLTTVPETV